MQRRMGEVPNRIALPVQLADDRRARTRRLADLGAVCDVGQQIAVGQKLTVEELRPRVRQPAMHNFAVHVDEVYGVARHGAVDGVTRKRLLGVVMRQAGDEHRVAHGYPFVLSSHQVVECMRVIWSLLNTPKFWIVGDARSKPLAPPG